MIAFVNMYDLRNAQSNHSYKPMFLYGATYDIAHSQDYVEYDTMIEIKTEDVEYEIIMSQLVLLIPPSSIMRVIKYMGGD